ITIDAEIIIIVAIVIVIVVFFIIIIIIIVISVILVVLVFIVILELLSVTFVGLVSIHGELSSQKLFRTDILIQDEIEAADGVLVQMNSWEVGLWRLATYRHLHL
ncbi:hypothetical protein BC829DRAFT_381985, partial [Chytridium lagenaria]